MDKDGYISNGELYQVLKMMVGNNLKDHQLQQIVDKTIIHADTDGDGKISFEEFCAVSISFPCLVNWHAVTILTGNQSRSYMNSTLARELLTLYLLTKF